MVETHSDPRRGTVAGWIAAFQILEKYLTGRSKNPVGGADHDVIYINGGPQPIEKEYTQEQLDSGEEPPDEEELEWKPEEKADAEALIALGFHWSGEFDGWAKFV